MSGFMVTGGTIPTPDLASEFTSTIPGRTSAGDSSITFYGSETGSDVRTVLPRNTVGFLLFADQGDASGKKADVYPIRVLSVGKMRSTGDEPYRIQIGFSITREPAEDIALPA